MICDLSVCGYLFEPLVFDFHFEVELNEIKDKFLELQVAVLVELKQRQLGLVVILSLNSAARAVSHIADSLVGGKKPHDIHVAYMADIAIRK